MNRTEGNSSAQGLKKTQLEEFDLVILGDGDREQQRTLPSLSEYAHVSGSQEFGNRVFDDRRQRTR